MRKRMMQLMMLVGVLGLGAFALTGCEKDAGDTVEDTMEEAGDAVDDAVDDAADAIDDATDDDTTGG